MPKKQNSSYFIHFLLMCLYKANSFPTNINRKEIQKGFFSKDEFASEVEACINKNEMLKKKKEVIITK